MEIKQDYILNLLHKNDKNGLKILFDKYFRALCFDALRIVGDLETAEDMVQDIFVRFWEQNTYAKIRENLGGYLYTSVRRRCYEYLEKENKLQLERNDNLRDIIIQKDQDETHSEELIIIIQKAIEKLPPKRKNAFKAVFISQMKYKEAALQMGVSVNTIKTHLSKATQKLREMLKNELLLIFFLIFF